nr:zinc finger MYM-type protein 1-like [Hydra vulgaris]
MASENIAFRVSSDRIFTENNGKFFKIVELFSKFDPVLNKHVKRAVEYPKKPHYLGKNIQQKIILLIAKATKDNILEMVKNAMYFSVIVDCTPDPSHKEQMSIVLRFVHITKSTKGSNASVEVKESFLKLINILDSIGAKMTEEILTFLTQNGLSILNLRGQGYDNGANMSGKINGVQAYIININPRAFFIACMFLEKEETSAKRSENEQYTTANT